MINELSEILITAISAVSGTGGIAGVLLWKHNKKVRELERQLKNAEVSKARIESKTDEWHLYKEQLDTANARILDLLKVNAEKEDRHMSDLKEKEERFNAQTDYLRGVQRDLMKALEREKEHIRKEGVLERRVAYLLNWLCKKSDCNHGIPPRARLTNQEFDESQIEEETLTKQ